MSAPHASNETVSDDPVEKIVPLMPLVLPLAGGGMARNGPLFFSRPAVFPCLCCRPAMRAARLVAPGASLAQGLAALGLMNSQITGCHF